MKTSKRVSPAKKKARTSGRAPAPRAAAAAAPGPAAAGATPPVTGAALSRATVLTVLGNGLGPLMLAPEFPLRTVVADDTYLEIAPDFIVNAIITDPVLSPKSYQADIFDCDDYVQYLKTKLSLYAAANHLTAPLAVGWLCTTKHAFTLCIGPNGQLFLINTQSDGHAVTSDPAAFRTFLSLRPDNEIVCIYL
jgi:hypothetical protein